MLILDGVYNVDGHFKIAQIVIRGSSIVIFAHLFYFYKDFKLFKQI